MVNLLIVDNEQVERKGMQAILQKAYPELVIKQAKNGQNAIQMAKDFKPNVILMDIKMPGMSGLEAFKRIIEDYPNIKFIMVTAYDTFDYVRQAIKLGAKDYLLKPSKVNEIEETVGKVLKQVTEEEHLLVSNRLQQETLQKTLPLVETDVVAQLLFDHVHEVHLDMLVDMLDIKSKNDMFVMIVLMPTKIENLYSLVKEKVRKTGSGWVGALYGRQIPIIVFRDPSKSFRSQAIQLAREILPVSKYGHEKDWFIGIGSVCGSFNQIRQSYQDSLVATMDITLPVKYRFYSDVPVLDTMCSSGQTAKYDEKEFLDQIHLGHWEQVRTSIMNLIQCYEKEGINLLQTQQSVLKLLWLASRALSEIGVETVTPVYSFQNQDYRQLRFETEHLVDQMMRSYVSFYDQLEADVIYQIKKYIIKHSQEDISLDVLGKQVGLSPVYISKMFKEKLGVNYIDFLTECRIEKAKKLMGNPDKSIKEIAFEVGYHEPNYFSKVFKKIANVSPKEYREKILGRKTVGR